MTAARRAARAGRARRAAPTANDLVVKAAAQALREFPRVNGAYRDGRFELYDARQRRRRRRGPRRPARADDLRRRPPQPRAEIAGAHAPTLVERARSGAITPPELSGGTFTVTNLGMLGVTSFTAIINPPQAANLTVGAVEARSCPSTARPPSAAMMTLTLVCDHRILYGADAARFLAGCASGSRRPRRCSGASQSRTRRRSPSTPARCAQKRAAAAPSMTRWS